MGELPELVFADDKLQTTIDLGTYRVTAVKKAAYRVADRCTAVLGSVSDQRLPVTFLFKAGTGERSARETVRAFFEELLDQDLREEVAEETAPIRALILAHAFSRTDLIRQK